MLAILQRLYGKYMYDVYIHGNGTYSLLGTIVSSQPANYAGKTALIV